MKIGESASINRRLMHGPRDHALTLHPATGLGRVSIARRLPGGAWHEQSVAVADLGYAVEHLANVPDVYLTQNRFFARRRLVSQLAQLDALFVDLDYYHTGHADAAPQHVLDLARDALQFARIPAPTLAINSGRGLALVWLHHPVPRAALPRWRACQGVLWEHLRHLGADRLATDAARVLRLVGTRNSRSDTRVETLMVLGEPWDFDTLADEILPVHRAELVSLRLARTRRAPRDGSGARPTRWFTAASLWELRLTELQKLRDHRWWQGTLPEGQRDLWMLLASTAIGYLVPGPMVRREIVALANEVTGGGWRERETLSCMSSVIARAEQAARGERIEYRGRQIDPRYRFRTATIVELLGINETEMRACEFRHLVSSDIRREHHRIGEEQRRRLRGSGTREDYESASLIRLKPWEATGISRASWYRHRETSACRCMVAKPSGVIVSLPQVAGVADRQVA
jgi:hypothetical protein